MSEGASGTVGAQHGGVPKWVGTHNFGRAMFKVIWIPGIETSGQDWGILASISDDGSRVHDQSRRTHFTASMIVVGSA